MCPLSVTKPHRASSAADPDPAFSSQGWVRWRVRLEERQEQVVRELAGLAGRLEELTRRVESLTALVEQGRGALWAGKVVWTVLGALAGGVAALVGHLLK